MLLIVELLLAYIDQHLSSVSTLLKTIAGHTHGLYLDKSSEFNYQGNSTYSNTLYYYPLTQ